MSKTISFRRMLGVGLFLMRVVAEQNVELSGRRNRETDSNSAATEADSVVCVRQSFRGILTWGAGSRGPSFARPQSCTHSFALSVSRRPSEMATDVLFKDKEFLASLTGRPLGRGSISNSI
jgi:hypothetical protein